MRSYSYLNTANQIIALYDGVLPFASWLKQYFKANKKFGSRDRKEISHVCHSFYRLGNAFQNLDFEERALTALLLCSTSPNKILEELKPGWNEKVTLSQEQKVNFLSAQKEIKKIFPFSDELSPQIDLDQFELSFLTQPNLYLRIRPGKKEKVLQRLNNTGIDFALLNQDCIQLPNQSKLDAILKLDEDVVIQDLNSQKTLSLLNDHQLQRNARLSLWDCCAASGGKSILFHDQFPESVLTVSDVRESILINLKKRFEKAGIKSYQSFVADVASESFSIKKKSNVVICDAPCSGSGTWSRTPELLHFFKRKKIEDYVGLQKRIVSNASKAVKQNGYFLYITCSVFKKENEDVVEFIENNLSLQLKSMQYLKGYDKKADTLFVALFSIL